MSDSLGELWLGTAGYSYADWVGPVYPAGTPTSAFLSEYANYFRMVELSFSYYRMPTAKALESIRAKAPSMHFTIKAHGSMTHERVPSAEIYATYRAALQPLIDSGKLLAVLLQFPTSFHRTPQNEQWLAYLREHLPDLPLVAEFRGREWVHPDVLDILRSLEIAWCAVDEPPLPALMPPVAAVTAPLSYVRLHGRNAANWFNPPHGWMRYDYLYSPEQLQFWVPKIERLLRETDRLVVTLNNHYRGQSMENAQMFAEDLFPPEVQAVLQRVEPPMPRVDSQRWRTA